jgi:hypothetical protein
LLIVFVMNDIWTRYEFIAYDNPVVTGANDVYLQQIQMADFLHTYYDDAVVAANDIGAINYYADIETVDLWGLGTVEVTRARQDNRYSTDVIRDVTAAYGTQIAVVYDTWYAAFGGLPDEWLLVGQWRIERAPVILGYHTVSFYAVNPGVAEELAANLNAYSDRLPAGIAVELAATGSLSVTGNVDP